MCFLPIERRGIGFFVLRNFFGTFERTLPPIVAPTSYGLGVPTYPPPFPGVRAKKGCVGSTPNGLVGLETHEPLSSEEDPFSERSGRRQMPAVSLEDFLPPNSSRFPEPRKTGLFVRVLGQFRARVRGNFGFSPGARAGVFTPSATADFFARPAEIFSEDLLPIYFQSIFY